MTYYFGQNVFELKHDLFSAQLSDFILYSVCAEQMKSVCIALSDLIRYVCVSVCCFEER